MARRCCSRDTCASPAARTWRLTCAPRIRYTCRHAGGSDERVTIERRALVLNQNYEPLNVCGARRAFVLVYHGKAEIIEAAEDEILGVEATYPLPSVIRLHQP